MEQDPAIVPATTRGRSVDGISLLQRRWRFLVVAAAVGTLVGTAYYLFSPKWYQAEIMIVPKEQPMGGLGAASALLGELPFDVGSLTSAASSDAERIAAILRSRSTTDAVIEKFGLINRYEVPKVEHARKALWGLCDAKVERKPNLVVLTCEDKDPVVARDMAEYFGKVGDEGFRRIATSSASEERKFLEKRAAEARRDLDQASRALREFQETHKIIDLPEQGKAVVSAMAALEGDLISKRVQLSYLRDFVSRDESSAAQLVRQIDVLQKELQLLEQRRSPIPDRVRRPSGSGTDASAGSDLFPAAMEVPTLRYELEALFREQKIRETVFLMLTQRFESLRVDEARDLATFVVFDHAALPTHRIRPRARIAPIAMVAGLAFGIMFVLVPAWWRDLRRRARKDAAT